MKAIYGGFNLPPIEIVKPKKIKFPIIFSCPHSGTDYPLILRQISRLDSITLRRSEDSFVDEIFAFAEDLKTPLIKANFPRAWVDVNRSPLELEQEMFNDKLPKNAETNNLIVKSGLGVIPSMVAPNTSIYNKKLCYKQEKQRIQTLHKLYHKQLKSLIDKVKKKFGVCFLIDCHSMPSTFSVGQIEHDIVLGDCFGKSCFTENTNLFKQRLIEKGYVVSVNSPFSGGFITSNYGNPTNHVQAIQIEIKRNLYMDEKTFNRIEGLEILKHHLKQIFEEIIPILKMA